MWGSAGCVGVRMLWKCQAAHLLSQGGEGVVVIGVILWVGTGPGACRGAAADLLFAPHSKQQQKRAWGSASAYVYAYKLCSLHCMLTASKKGPKQRCRSGSAPTSHCIVSHGQVHIGWLHRQGPLHSPPQLHLVHPVARPCTQSCDVSNVMRPPWL